MGIELYIPAVIVMGAAVFGFFFGLWNILANFTDGSQTWGQGAGMALGIALVYAAPVAFLIGLGIQIAHWA